MTASSVSGGASVLGAIRVGAHLASRSVRVHPWRTIILIAALAVTMTIPLATSWISRDARNQMTARADSTPMMIARRGSPFDALIGGLWFRRPNLETMPFSRLNDVMQIIAASDSMDATVIPIHTRFMTRKQPIVATAPDYFAVRGLTTADGEFPLLAGEAVVGATAAKGLQVRVGDTIESETRDAFDITAPPTIRMPVVGVLAATGTPDDEAVFVDMNTAWLLEGRMHMHDAEDDAEVLADDGDHRIFSPDLIESQDAAGSGVQQMHMHGDPNTAPLTAILVFPAGDARAQQRTRDMLRARVNIDPAIHAIHPRSVVDEVLAIVIRVRRLVDLLALVLALATIVLGSLVVMQSVHARAREFEVLARMGAPRLTSVMMIGWELVVVVLAAAAFAFAAASTIRILIQSLPGGLTG